MQEERDRIIFRIQQSFPTNCKEQIYNERKRYFVHFDAYLDSASTGPVWLQQTSVAQTLADKLHSLHNLYYELIAFCLMPNHVHLLIKTAIQLENLSDNEEPGNHNYKQLYEVMQRIKGGSAYEMNKLLNRNGKLWQKESYDHVVRNPLELKNIIQYILQNPIKAGLVNDWQDWKFSYLNEKYL